MKKLLLITSVLALCACSPIPTIDKPKDFIGPHTLFERIFVQDFAALNVIGGLCAFLAVAAVVAKSLGVPIPMKTFWTLIVCAIGSWLLRGLIHDITKWMWLIELVALIGSLVGAAGFAYGHKAWIEKRLNVDVNKNGKIG